MPTTKSVPKSKTNTIKSRPNKLFKIGVISPLRSTKQNVLNQAMMGFCELGFETRIIAEGDETSQKICLDLLGKYPDKFSVHESILNEKENIITQSDIIVFDHKPLKSELALIIKHNIPCVLPEGCGLENFNPQKECGESFTYTMGNFWTFMSAVIRASENKKFSYDWRVIRRNLAKITEI
ncbi:hypothetical protein CSB37_04000 [bacterium DOLZORAL124_38_8]|nr:MAG: hypothetical protein CSB37_04000 [bacterium DOLZORAL124_38_8]